MFHNKIPCVTSAQLDEFPYPAPGNMDPSSPKYAFLCRRYQELKYLISLPTTRFVHLDFKNKYPIHVFKQPKIVWELFIGDNFINGRNLSLYGITHTEITFIRNAPQEYRTRLKQFRMEVAFSKLYYGCQTLFDSNSV